MAKLAEKGKITSIFFADAYAGRDYLASENSNCAYKIPTADETYQGKFDATYRGGSMVAQLEPTVFISAMAAVTKSVSFGITGSTSYIPVSKSPCSVPRSVN